jgi:hypothetical protein
MAWTSGDFEELLIARAAVAFAYGEEFTQKYLLDAVRDRDVVYTALKSEDEREIWGLVLIVKREGERLHIKRISEDMGPDDDRCRVWISPRMPICRDSTGATGLEPATSGVTGLIFATFSLVTRNLA